MMRTRGNVVCRFRADLPDDLVDHLQHLGTRERTPPGMLPALYSQYLDALTAHARVDRAGPVYMCSQGLAPRGSIVPITEENAELLRSGFEHWLADIPRRQPFMALVKPSGGFDLCQRSHFSSCSSRRGGNTSWLSPERLRRKRGSGLGDGCAGTRRRSLLQHVLENHASQRVAARLGLSLVGVDFHVT